MHRDSPKRLAAIATVAVATQISGCDTAGYRATANDITTVELNASRKNAGATGKAFLIPRGNDTQVRIDVSGSNVPVTAPVQLYMFVYEGHCGTLGTQPKYTLTQVVQAQSALNPTNLGSGAGPWRLANTAPASIAVLRGTPHAIVVRTSPADANVDLFCGDI